MPQRCVILDDYQNVALKMADWSPVGGDLDITVHEAHLVEGSMVSCGEAFTGVNSAVAFGS